MGRETLSDKQRVWLQHIEACAAAGVSMKAYAEKHGLDLQRFYFWKGQLKKLGVIDVKAGGRSLDAVRVVPAADPGARIQLSNGVSIEVRNDFDAAAMTALLAAAKRL